ncbi:MAG: dihydroorotase [Prevotella sp.]|nr:dihydroorotase [Prevotella sp.]
MKLIIENGTIVNENRTFKGSIVIDNGHISEIVEDSVPPRSSCDERVDAAGCFVFPGVIDSHVHFREPGLTEKADIESESRAAAYGGVTSYFDMPNTVPQTTTLDALADKFDRGRKSSHVNYSFFYGATNDNGAEFEQLDRQRIPGIKLFMGSSTGNMLVDKYGSLLKIFETAARLDLPIMAHCEDTDIINRNMAQMKKAYGDDPDVALHPLIRSEEACYESSALAVELARTYGTRLHVAHVSTAKELELFQNPSQEGLPQITAEATVAHLFFTSQDYATKRALIKCNPAIKSVEDRDALRKAIVDGRITTIGTDHAPHLLEQKQGGCAKAVSGMPMIQFSLPTMLELVDEGVLGVERLVELMCHHPAKLFEVRNRGFIRKGYKADLVIVSCGEPWTVTEETIQSKCKWSPMMGHSYRWRVRQTICNGRLVYNDGIFDNEYRGEEVAFR